MKKNMGNTDRILRALLAIVMGYLYFSGTIPGALGVILIVLAVVFLATSLFSICPIYSLLGINSCGVKGQGSR